MKRGAPRTRDVAQRSRATAINVLLRALGPEE